MKTRRFLIGALALGLVVSAVGLAAAAQDFGLFRDGKLASSSERLFGVDGTLASSSTSSVSAAQALADPTSLVTLAKGLRAHVVTSGVAGQNLDQMVLWPTSHPTSIIACNEEGTTQPGLQRISLSTGTPETIVTGTTSCDPVRLTPWGTILFGEEAGGGPSGGRMYELIDPLHTTGVTLDRTTGVFSGGTGAANLVARPALGRVSFEGLAILPNGVTYYGDENRPSVGTAGGAFFKFIPSTLHNPSAGSIQNLWQSPYAVPGSIYGLRLGKRSGNTDYGQRTESGLGSWIQVTTTADPDLRAEAATLKLTGFYRPEDMEFDRNALAMGSVRWCSPATGNESEDHLWGTVPCVTDGTVAEATANTATPEAQPFLIGNPQLAMPDNIAQQPGTGNFLIHEDGDGPLVGRSNDLWDCLPDGADADQQTDGCVRIASINDLVGTEGGAEWTGGFFDASGRHFYVSIQHNITGFGTILRIDGWDRDSH